MRVVHRVGPAHPNGPRHPAAVDQGDRGGFGIGVRSRFDVPERRRPAISAAGAAIQQAAADFLFKKLRF